jgi:1-acyl-sn-glycerol-3-phosphate acyltransferase
MFNGSAKYRALQILGQSVFIPLWRLSVRGRRHVPKTGGVVAISNHQSFLDLILIGQALPREITYIARTSLWNSFAYRALTWPFTVMGIRRGEADLGAIKEAIDRLKRGELLLLFPEGTRTRTGKVGPFSMGFYTMAHRAGVPVLPIRIQGSFQAWPRWQPLPRPAQITLDIFEPFTIGDRSKEEVREFLERTIYKD